MPGIVARIRYNRYPCWFYGPLDKRWCVISDDLAFWVLNNVLALFHFCVTRSVEVEDNFEVQKLDLPAKIQIISIPRSSKGLHLEIG